MSTAFLVVRADLSGLAAQLRAELPAEIGKIGAAHRTIQIKAALEKNFAAALRADVQKGLANVKLTVPVTPVIIPAEARASLAAQLAKLGPIPVPVTIGAVTVPPGTGKKVTKAVQEAGIAGEVANVPVRQTAPTAPAASAKELAAATAKAKQQVDLLAQSQVVATSGSQKAIAAASGVTQARLAEASATEKLAAANLAGAKTDDLAAAALAARSKVEQAVTRQTQVAASEAAKTQAAVKPSVQTTAGLARERIDASRLAVAEIDKQVARGAIDATVARDNLATATRTLRELEVELTAAKKTGNKELVREIELLKVQATEARDSARSQLAARTQIVKATNLAGGVATAGQFAGTPTVAARQVFVAASKEATAAEEALALAVKTGIQPMISEAAAVNASSKAKALNAEASYEQAKATDLAAKQATKDAAAQAKAAAATSAAAQRTSANAATTVSQATRGVAATSAGFLGLRGAVLAASGPFLAATIAVTGLAKVIGAGSSLQKNLIVFQSVSGATADQMKRVSDEARSLGADLTLPATSANDAAAAMTELARAGLSVNDSLDAARGVLQLAAAASISVGDASTIVATELNAFGLAGSQATHVADLLTGASISAQGEITDFALAFQQVAAVAHQVQLPIETTTALLTQFAQRGLRGCYDNRTDVLTRSGWKSWADVTMEDEFATVSPETGNMEYQLPERLVRYQHTGKMYEVRNDNVDLCVTPDHRMWVSKRGFNKGSFQVMTAEEIYGKSVQYQASVGWVGNDEPTVVLPGFDQPRGRWTKKIVDFPIAAEDWAAFMGYYLSEGSSDFNRGSYRISIAQRNGEKKDKMLSDLSRLGFKVSENKRALTICSEQLYRAVSDIGHTVEKRVPREMLEWSPRLLRIFHEAFRLGDGDDAGILYTSSIELRDDLEEVILKCGWATKHRLSMPAGKQSTMADGRTITATTDGWKIATKTSQTRPAFDNSNVHAARREGSDRVYERWIDYDGEVFCATVPNHLLIVRRNGTVIVSGNSDAGTSLRTMLLRLVPSSKAAAEAQKELGIQIDRSLPIGKQFSSLIDQYSRALARLGPVAQQEALTKIFGQDAIRGASISLTQGSAALTAIETTVNKAGAAASVSSARMKGFSGSIEGLKSQVQTLAGTVGTEMLPILTSTAKELASVTKAADSAAGALTSVSDVTIKPVANLLGGSDVLAQIGLAAGAGFGIQKLVARRRAAAAAVLEAETAAAAASAAAQREAGAIISESAIATSKVQVASAEAAGAANVAAAAASARAWKLEAATVTVLTGQKLKGLLSANKGLIASIAAIIAGQQLENQKGGAAQVGSALSTIGTGALIGSFIGPEGTVAGAAVGALLAGIQSGQNETARNKSKWDALTFEEQLTTLTAGGVDRSKAYAAFGLKLKQNPATAQSEQNLSGFFATLTPGSARLGQDFLSAAASPVSIGLPRVGVNPQALSAFQTSMAQMTGNTGAILVDAERQVAKLQSEFEVLRRKAEASPPVILFDQPVALAAFFEKQTQFLKDATKKANEFNKATDNLIQAMSAVPASMTLADTKAQITPTLTDNLAEAQAETARRQTQLDAAIDGANKKVIAAARQNLADAQLKESNVQDQIVALNKADAAKRKADADALKSLTESNIREAAALAGNLGPAEDRLIALDKINIGLATGEKHKAAQLVLVQDLRTRNAAQKNAADAVRAQLEQFLNIARQGGANLAAFASKRKQFVLGGQNPGLKAIGNLDLLTRPEVPNPAGGTSSVFSESRQTDQGFILLTRVFNGKVQSSKAAWQHFLKTGENLGLFISQAAADSYSKRLHLQQATLTGTKRFTAQIRALLVQEVNDTSKSVSARLDAVSKLLALDAEETTAAQAAQKLAEDRLRSRADAVGNIGRLQNQLIALDKRRLAAAATPEEAFARQQTLTQDVQTQQQAIASLAETALRAAADAADHRGKAEQKLIDNLNKQVSDTKERVRLGTDSRENLNAAQKAFSQEVLVGKQSVVEAAKASIDLQRERLDTSLAAAQRTPGLGDDRAVLRNRISLEGDILKKMQETLKTQRSTSNEYRVQAIAIEQQKRAIGDLQDQLKGVSGSGFSLPDLFKESLSQFAQFSSNVSTHPLTPGGARGQFAGSILKSISARPEDVAALHLNSVSTNTAATNVILADIRSLMARAAGSATTADVHNDTSPIPGLTASVHSRRMVRTTGGV